MGGLNDPETNLERGARGGADDGVVTLALMVAPGIAAAASFAMLPVILGALARGWSLSDPQLGLLASVELGGLTLGTLLAVLLTRRWGARAVALAAMTFLVAANLASMLAPSVTGLMALRAIAGLATGGGLAVCYANLAGTARAERNFAIFTLAQLLLGALGLLSMPHLVGLFGWRAPYGLLAVVAGCGATAVGLLRSARPEAPAERVATAARSRLKIGPRAWSALAGVGFYFAGVGSVWAYAERIGGAAGIGAGDVAAILAGSQVVAMVGALCAGLLAGRAPVLAGLILGSLLTAFGMGALVVVREPIGFALAVSAVNFGWNYVSAPQFAAIAKVDADGSVAGLMSTITGVGVAVGPALGAQLVLHGFAPLLMVAEVLILASLILIWPASSARVAAARTPSLEPAVNLEVGA
ncbi:MAG: MFS transporter [Caulobacteraceae bacterium]|nr:MFS transporter [Caulobacteraceae bacterium]